MKVVVHIKYGTETHVARILVGDAKKSIKWLGLVAAQRFCNRAPRGMLRHRENTCPVPHGCALLPVRVFSSEEDVYHPDHILADQLCDGQHVTVVLGHSLALQGHTGRAALEGFPLLAFNKAVPEAGRAKAWDDMQHMANARKEKAQAMAAADAQRRRESKAKAVRQLLGLQANEEEESDTWLLNTFTRVWSRLTLNRHVEELFPEEEGRERLRKLLLQHFRVLYEIFTRFSSQQDGALSFDDFLALVEELKLAEGASGLSTELLRRLYVDSDCGSGPESYQAMCLGPSTALLADPTLHLDMSGFLLVLVHLSCSLYIDSLLGSRLPQLSLLELRRRRAVLGPLSHDPLPGVVQALTQLLADHVAAYARAHLSDVLIKQTAASTDVLATFADYQQPLQKVFVKWAGKARSAFGPPTMTFFNFKEFALDCKLADEHDVASLKRLKAAFFACKKEEVNEDGKTTPQQQQQKQQQQQQQQNNRRGSDPKSRGKEQQGEAEVEDDAVASVLVTYGEWLEAVVRVGVGRFEDPRLSLAEKMIHTVKVVVGVA